MRQKPRTGAEAYLAARMGDPSYAAAYRTARQKIDAADGSAAVVELTDRELLAIIDRRARALLGIAGEEFVRRYRAGELQHSAAEGPIVVLAQLLERPPQPR